MTIEVAGVGMGRTGTLSLKLALEMLGFGPCYHMTELLHTPARVDFWRRAWAGDADALARALAGYRSTTDFPAHGLYAQLYQTYPSARFILTTRHAERWYDSAAGTIFNAKPGFAEYLSIGLRMPFNKGVRQTVDVYKLVDLAFQRDFDGRLTDRAHCIQRFKEHEDNVRAVIPADQLLVFEVKDGWEPLCAFLGVDVPDVPFPRANDHSDWWSRRKQGATSMLSMEPPRGTPLS